MIYLGTWFSGVLGSVGLEVGFCGLKGLVQPNGFYDSIYKTHVAYPLCMHYRDILSLMHS